MHANELPISENPAGPGDFCSFPAPQENPSRNTLIRSLLRNEKLSQPGVSRTGKKKKNETKQAIGFSREMCLSAFSVPSQGILSPSEPLLEEPKWTSRPALSCKGEIL